MTRPLLYLDEDVYFGVAQGLRLRGFDVLTTVEAGCLGATDEEQLYFSIEKQRTLFTFNRGDFARLHNEMLTEEYKHFGIIVARQLPVGVIVKSLCKLLANNRAEDLRNQLIWLTAS